MKKLNHLHFCLFFALFTFTSYTFAQATDSEAGRDYKVRPIRVGVKLGFPNFVGGNLEYVTPLLNDRLSVSLDYSTIKSDWFLSEEEKEDSNLDLTYLEAGINYYFFKAGKGLYGGLGYNNLKLDGEVAVSKEGVDGTGNINYTHGSIDIKLGAKIGGLFYLRPEVGYSFSSLPKTIEYTAEYEDGTTETEIYDLVDELAVPEIFFKGFMANIGIGFAF